MSFYNVHLLAFAAGGLIPIIIHLLHRQKYKRVRWAAMEFLLAAVKKTQKRLRVENLLLLLVRILIMVLLAFALARPSFSAAPLEILADSDTHHIFVIDNSYSMGYKRAQESCLQLAQKAAEAKLGSIRKLTQEDKISILLMSSYPEVWMPATNRKDNALSWIAGIKLSHYGTSLYATLQKVKAMIDESRNQEKQVYVFTDFQRVGWEPQDETEARRLGELTRALKERKDVSVSFIDVGTDGADNRAIVDLRCENSVVTTKQTARFTVDLYNYSSVNFPAVPVNFHVNGSLVKTDTVALPANSGMSLPFRHDFVVPGPYYVEATAESDFLDLDDRRGLSLEVRDGLKGILVDGEPSSGRMFTGETDYLRLLFDSTSIFKLERIVNVSLFDAEKLEQYDFVALCNVKSLTSDRVEKLERFVQGGGGLLIALGNLVDRGWYNQFLWRERQGLLPAELVEISGSPPEHAERAPVRILNYRTNHRIFAPFTKGLAKAPRELIFYQYYRLANYEPAGVVAELDDNFATPLFVEKQFGEGRVLLFNNTVDDGWNHQVPGRPPWSVMMVNACEQLAARPGARHNLFVGDHISVQLTADNMPAGERKMFLLDAPGEGQMSIAPEATKEDSPTILFRYPRSGEPKPGERAPVENEGLKFAGKYTLDKAAKKEDEPPIAYFAVNLPPRTLTAEELQRVEGNLERIPEEEIRRRLPDFRFDIIGKKKASEEVALRAPAAGLWKYLLYLVFALLGAESLLAWLFGRAKA